MTKKELLELKKVMMKKMEIEDARYVKCQCGEGVFGGIFMVSCDNPKCVLYDYFSMQTCRICGVARRQCSC